MPKKTYQCSIETRNLILRKVHDEAAQNNEMPSIKEICALCGLSSGADTLLVIALDAKTATLAAALENTGLAVQAQDGANWIELLTDPTAFTLQTRDATGVEHVPQPYHIGEDGLPALGTN